MTKYVIMTETKEVMYFEHQWIVEAESEEEAWLNIEAARQDDGVIYDTDKVSLNVRNLMDAENIYEKYTGKMCKQEDLT